jgi:hypothetical protein
MMTTYACLKSHALIASTSFVGSRGIETTYLRASNKEDIDPATKCTERISLVVWEQRLHAFKSAYLLDKDYIKVISKSAV